MKYLFFLFSILLPYTLKTQTVDLYNFDVTLVGPYNTDRHHPAQVDYYIDYLDYLLDEVEIWLKELNVDIREIRKRNRKRIERKRPVKARDYPKWKKSKEIIKSLEEDKILIEAYVNEWESFNYAVPDSVVNGFMAVFDTKACYDLISRKLVLAPTEYKITLFEPEVGYFDWLEFIPKTSYRCPEGYEPAGKTCSKKLELAITDKQESTFLIFNLLNDLPFHLDGFKQITCKE